MSLKARINRIKIENIKSYHSSEIFFPDGITVISGKNGAGKSSLFESLGFCLFGVKPETFIGNCRNFIRMGEESGRVEVEFCNESGDTYRVIRSITPDGAGDPRLEIFRNNSWEKVLISGVYPYVRDLLKLETGMDMSKQFADIIGPFQTDFIAPFLIRNPQTREKGFDDMLGITKWRRFYEKSDQWAPCIESKIRNLEETITLKQRNIEDLPEKKIEYDKLKKEKDHLQLDLDKAYKEIENAEKNLQEMEKLRAWLMDLETRTDTVVQQKTTKEEMLAERREDLEIARNSFRLVKENETAYHEYEKSVAEKIKIEEKLKKQKLLAERSEEIKKRLLSEREALDGESIRNRLEQEKLTELVESTKRELEIKSLELREVLMEIQKMKISMGDTRKILEDFSLLDMSMFRKCRESMEYVLDKSKKLSVEIEAYRQEIVKLPELLEKRKKAEEVEAELSELTEKILSLRLNLQNNIEFNKTLLEKTCPIFEELCPVSHDKDPNSIFEKKNQEISLQIEETEKRKNDLTLSFQEFAQIRDQIVRIEEWQKLVKIEEEKIEDFYRDIKVSLPVYEISEFFELFESLAVKSEDEEVESNIRELQEQVDNFEYPENMSNYPEILKKLEQKFITAHQNIISIMKGNIDKREMGSRDINSIESELKASISHLKERLAESWNELEKAVANEKRLSKMNLELEMMEKEVANIDDSPGELENLIRILEALNRSLEKNRDGYTIFNQHIRITELLPRMEKDVKKLEKDIRDLDYKIKAFGVQIKYCTDRYDEDKMYEAKEKLEYSRSAIKTSEVRFFALSDQIETLKNEIEKMTSIQKEIEKMETQKNEYYDTLSFSRVIRNDIIRNIAPALSSTIREHLSDRANRIFRSISGNNRDLRWGESYSIQIIDLLRRGRHICSDHQLSGGQLMAAIISLRLALLEMTGSPFAFFDEPTTSLDETRRKNLVESIREIDMTPFRWYRQLFLISQDEAFYGLKGNHIEMELDESGCTRIN